MSKSLKLGKTKTIKVPVRPFLKIVLHDQSTWFDIAHYPDTQTCRRFIALVDYLVQSDPHSPWWTWRAAYLHPEWSFREIADFLGIAPATVIRHLSEIPIPQNCFFSENERL